MLLHPGVKTNDLTRKRYAWMSMAVTFITVTIVLAGFLIAGREYKTLISYMIVLLAGLSVIQIIMVFFNPAVLFLSFLANIWLIDISFVYILKLGGITYSAGLAIAGLAAVITSLACQTTRCIIVTMILYLLTIIAAGIVHPWLTVPQEMTPAINNRMFVLIIVLVSINGLFWVISIQKKKKRESGFEQTGAGLDDQFLKKINALLESNIDDPLFDISQLCRDMGVSRAQIYRKFKSPDDRSLHNYLRFYRLNRAKELLLTTTLNVSEVAYRTGFTNVSHFSRVFTEEFGKHPSDYRKRCILLA